MFEHIIEHPRDFMSRGRNGLGSAVFSPHAPIKGSQGAMTPTDALSGHAEGLSRAIG